MDLGFNYNTEATFDFENQLNLDYSGKEDDILQKLEAGNVSLPLNSTLISGSQSLFGVKSELKFGRLSVTSVMSQQKGNKRKKLKFLEELKSTNLRLMQIIMKKIDISS